MCGAPLLSAFPVLKQTTIRDENFGSEISISCVQVKTHISSMFSPSWTHIPHEATPTAHVTRLCSDSAVDWLCLRQESKQGHDRADAGKGRYQETKTGDVEDAQANKSNKLGERKHSNKRRGKERWFRASKEETKRTRFLGLKLLRVKITSFPRLHALLSYQLLSTGRRCSKELAQGPGSSWKRLEEGSVPGF